MVNERVGASNWEDGDELGNTWVSRNAFRCAPPRVGRRAGGRAGGRGDEADGRRGRHFSIVHQKAFLMAMGKAPLLGVMQSAAFQLPV